MRLRHIPGAAAAVAASELVVDEQSAPQLKGRWQEVFANPQPIHLEIGMGRGRFLLAAAMAYHELNFLGLEKREEVIMQALERMKQPPPNLRLLWLDAARLAEVFSPGELEHIYLNFPDPWPKARHAKRRLTAPGFLAFYREILAPGGVLTLKTDNAALFEWSQESFQQAGWQALRLAADLPQEQAGISSEYERRYRRQGKPIYLGEWRTV
jgi:tRNA (guanine-N7-)-methyltransferase